MRKIWFALLFFAGGLAHEVRNPTSCHAIATSHATGTRRRRGA
jgi:hypothetical protein